MLLRVNRRTIMRSELVKSLKFKRWTVSKRYEFVSLPHPIGRKLNLALPLASMYYRNPFEFRTNYYVNKLRSRCHLLRPQWHTHTKNAIKCFTNKMSKLLYVLSTGVDALQSIASRFIVIILNNIDHLTFISLHFFYLNAHTNELEWRILCVCRGLEN